MGRKRTNPASRGLPPGLHLKNGRFYFVTTVAPRKWIALGPDRATALVEWARIVGTEADESVRTFDVVAAKYEREVLPRKALRTREDNRRELVNLRAVFGPMLIDNLRPHMVRRYLDERGATGKTRANREKALLSHIFNCAREWGFTDAPNPCAGVKGFKEAGRDRYVSDAEFAAVYAHAGPILRDAMDLALLTGQRPADLLKMTRDDLRDGALFVRQNKTGAKRAIAVTGELAALIHRIVTRPRVIQGRWLIQTDHGQPWRHATLRAQFAAARKAAGVDFQFRDIRAKTASDADDLAHAQQLLGHKTRAMTEHYTRERVGIKVKPLR